MIDPKMLELSQVLRMFYRLREQAARARRDNRVVDCARLTQIHQQLWGEHFSGSTAAGLE